jgi:acyl-CoA reductase-like NAD-dependent aldehyde dehydrogenase
VDESKFEAAKEGTTYVAPVVLVDVNHEMEVMMEEVSLTWFSKVRQNQVC